MENEETKRLEDIETERNIWKQKNRYTDIQRLRDRETVRKADT